MLAPLWLTALLALAPLAHTSTAADPADLVGTWTVDLRPSPDAPAYLQEFVVTAVDGDRIEGTFYGSAISATQINAEWDGVWFAFETSDASTRYVTTGRLLDGVLTGTTYAPERELLMPWRAVRAD